MKNYKIRICKNCGKEFSYYIAAQKYCNVNCRKKPNQAQYPGINRTNAGAVSELLVCADLLKKGFEVFRSVSPVASCDLIVKKNNIIYDVEVKSFSPNTDNGIKLLYSQIRAKWLAYVDKGKINYYPDLTLGS